MRKFAFRALGFAVRKLTAINDSITKDENDKTNLAREKHWNDKFGDKEFFDHSIDSNIKIRLYRDSILSKLIYNGFENAELDFLRNFLREGDTFFDIGSNIGLFSLVASTRIGDEGKIFAFEPSPKTYARLKENLKNNNISDQYVFNIGLSDKIDKLQLNISDNGYDAWNSFADSKDGKFSKVQEVDVDTLDNIANRYGVRNIDLIKLDVEGWEKFVLYGGERTMKDNSPVIMVEFTEENTFSAGYHVQELYDILEAWGYKWYRYIDKKLVFEKKQLHYPYDNLFAIKDIDTVNKRLAID
ncbi:FkbM family methyltransferase [Hymenobacter radiodurans]|uniref:FkbM family methyltransferase n=1 Tax=Hymenobacter radiodurans TaxID=2496028 RepID=UPI00105904CA|nr:FkbM family methyltransferase [Hymenobacter radiodurans]